MAVKPPAEKPAEEEEVERKVVPVDSKFRFVLVAAQRAEQLMRGARPKIEAGKSKPTRVAMQEVDLHLIDWDYGPAPVAEPAPAAEGDEAPAAAN